MNELTELFNQLLQSGKTRKISLASDEVLSSFGGLESHCHENVAKWVEEHPSHRAVHGWVSIGSGLFIKHSVVDTGTHFLLDVTPRASEQTKTFLCFIEWDAVFDICPSQIC